MILAKTKDIHDMKRYCMMLEYVDKSCDYYDYVSQAVSLIKSNDCDHDIFVDLDKGLLLHIINLMEFFLL